MKKNLLYMLTAAAMLAGCAKNDVVDSEINKEGNLIGFSTYKNISRGNPVDNNNEFLTKDNAFGVTALSRREQLKPQMQVLTWERLPRAFKSYLTGRNGLTPKQAIKLTGL